MLLGAVAAQEEEYRTGRRLERAVRPVGEICVEGTRERSFCNGSPNPSCDATGLVVSIVRSYEINCEVHGEFNFSVALA